MGERFAHDHEEPFKQILAKADAPERTFVKETRPEAAMVTLRKIELNGSNTNDAIVPFETQYLVQVCGRWRAGSFDQQWYGLNFTSYGSEGIELEAIDAVYEITEAVLDTIPTLPVAYLENA